jgi:hypothetical protein
MVLSVSALLMGCGRQYSGVYQGIDRTTQVGTQQQDYQMTLTLNDSGGDSVSGTWQSSNGTSGTFNGTVAGDGMNATLTQSSGGYYNPVGTCQQSWTGILMSPNTNQLTGTLNPVGGCGYVSNSRTIDVTK